MTYVGKKPADIIATAVDTTTGTFSGDLTVDTNTLYVDSANNRVGVGTTSPNANTKLDVNGAARIGNSTDGIMIENNTGSFDIDNASYIRRDSSSGALEITSGSTTARNMIFNTKTSGAESARIDSSGNLLVGKTSADNGGTVGAELNTNDTAYFTRSGGAGVNINRTTSDGNIALFQKDGTEVGSIGSEGGDSLYIISGDTGLRFSGGADVIIPVTTAGAARDAAIDLASSGAKFKDLYLSGSAYTSNIYGQNDTNTGIQFEGSDIITIHTAGAERMRIHSNGNFTIGTTNQSPAESSTATGARIGNTGKTQISSDSGETLMLNRNTNDGTLINFRRAGAEVGAIQSFSGCLAIGSYVGNDAFIRFGNSDVRPVNSSGTDRDNGIDLGASVARFKDLYLSGGVYVGGTGSANHLDDYEEGTFTPTWQGYPVDKINSTSGKYVKVGNQVTVYAKLVTGTDTDASAVAIQNLPFTISGDIGAGSIYHNTAGLREMHIVTSFNSNSTQCNLHGVLSGTDTTIKYVGTAPAIGGSSTLIWILHYQTI